MNLQIRDPRARELARKLSERKKTSMTEAVIGALEAALQRAEEEKPLRERVRPIIEELTALAQPGGRDMTKDEIDEMWGH
jgi:antitoxin VapB